MKNNFLKKISVLLCVACLGIPTVSPVVENSVIEVQAASKVKLNKSSLSLNKGKTYTLKLQNNKKKVKWSSSNTKVATVNSKGKVTAKGVGTATITAKVGSTKYTCKITVKQLVTSVKLNKTTLSLKNGDFYNLKVTIKPSNASNKGLKYATSNSKVVTIDKNGKLVAKGKGTATITITATDGSKKKATCKVTVTDNKVIVATSVNLNYSKLTINKGDTKQLTATVLPSNTANKTVTYSSSNSDIATVSASGLVTARSAGTAIITAKTSNGKTSTCTVVVNPTYAKLVSITGLDSSKIKIGNSVTLKATVTPSDVTTKGVNWSSSNNSLATVDANGKVTFKVAGTVKITCASKDGKATSILTITIPKNEVIQESIDDDTVYVKSINLTGLPNSVKVDDTFTLKTSITPSNATNKGVTWKSSNTKVATVTSTGTVKCVGTGTVDITCSSNDGKCTAKATFTVNSKAINVSNITISSLGKSLVVGENAQLIATITPSNATNKAVKWSSSNTSVVTVGTTGYVTAKGKGTATIYCESADGYVKAYITITVVEQPVTKITISGATSSKKVGETMQLTATVTPSDANQNVIWSSSDTSLATVDANGLVTLKKAGTVKISCAAQDKSYTASVTFKIGEATSIPDTSDTTVSVTGLTLSGADISPEIGKSVQITANVTPDNATNKNVTWKSSDSSVATVTSNGKVTFLKAGTVTITCTTEDKGLVASVKYTIPEATSDSTVSLDVSTTKIKSIMEVGETQTLEATVLVNGKESSQYKKKYTSSDTSIATISDTGLITAKKAGSVSFTISVEGTNIKTSNLTISVVDVQSKNVSISGIDLTKCFVGESLQLRATVSPSDATQDVTWSSSNTSVATITSNGLLNFVGAGSVTISATANDSAKAGQRITITVNKRSVTGISIVEPDLSQIKVGNTVRLTATVTPSNATDKTIIWTSSDTSVATVDANGNVKFLKSGKVTITASANDGSAAKSQINFEL